MADGPRMIWSPEIRSFACALDIVVSPHLPLDHVGDELPYMPPLVRNPRSRRLWKKLCQRRRRLRKPIMERRSVYMVGNRVFMHPDQYQALQRQLAARSDRTMDHQDDQELGVSSTSNPLTRV